MDTTETYIKMCEKAEEIQKLWKHSRRSSGDWYFHIILNSAYVITSIDQEDADCIWLPRQDQLQILSGLSWREFDVECQRYDVETKEQAGIQAVMGRKFRKNWHNNEWILDNTI